MLNSSPNASAEHRSGTPSVSGEFLVNVLSEQQRARLRFLVCVWLVSLCLFYGWWFRTDHIVGFGRYLVNTLLITWLLVLPGYWLFFVLQMKRVNPQLAIPTEWRIAMITTRAPSEPFDVVKRTLLAMLSQQTPHDTWLADEDPTPDILAWCEQHGVNVSSRRGVSAYHRDTWPRRTKCKEGNLAYFYDHFGYDNYDLVVQLDADHVPDAGYLEAMLRPFLDPSVGYVSAPSLCDSNASSSWSARGRLYSEAIMHGPLQAGYTNGYAPLCIGSHYAVRTAALRQIGGIGPELAEDHSTTLLMNSYGWRGMHALDAIAHGEGPPTFEDCVVQEFQWSRSLMVVFLTLLPKCWKRLSKGARFQFLFSELWYPMFSVTVFSGLLLPVLAIMWRESWVNVSYIDFLIHSLPLLLTLLAIQRHLREAGVLRPVDSPLLSWEAALFQIVRWPWSLYGSLMGVWMVLNNKTVIFRVTPKGAQKPTSLSWQILVPYMVILMLTYLPTVLVADAGRASGYYFFLILTQVSYTVALFCLVLVHCYEVARNR
jgi:cellulose synthase (UDP-forming)